MASIDILQSVDIIEAMENYISEIRPPEEIRDKLDVSYKIEGQSIFVFEIRPIYFSTKNEKQECMVAKATFVKAKNHWKVFWRRADLKWHLYKPHPTVKTINEFINLIREDELSCFWG